jgi:hypothetical protein
LIILNDIFNGEYVVVKAQCSFSSSNI